jgi:hypothetical protein
LGCPPLATAEEAKLAVTRIDAIIDESFGLMDAKETATAGRWLFRKGYVLVTFTRRRVARFAQTGRALAGADFGIKQSHDVADASRSIARVGG